MIAEFLKYASVYFSSTIKFIFGPVLGITYELPIIWVILLTALGMMTTVYLLTYFGKQIRHFFKRFQTRKRIFSKRSRRFVTLWRKFGLIGVCLLTPLIFTPPGGAILVNLLEPRKGQILKWMWISALGWSTILTLLVNSAFWLFDGLL